MLEEIDGRGGRGRAAQRRSPGVSVAPPPPGLRRRRLGPGHPSRLGLRLQPQGRDEVRCSRRSTEGVAGAEPRRGGGAPERPPRSLRGSAASPARPRPPIAGWGFAFNFRVAMNSIEQAAENGRRVGTTCAMLSLPALVEVRVPGFHPTSTRSQTKGSRSVGPRPRYAHAADGSDCIMPKMLPSGSRA